MTAKANDLQDFFHFKMSKNFVYGGKSYHIEQCFGTNHWIVMWPMASFGVYCLEKNEAEEELRNLSKNESSSKFRLVSMTAVMDGNMPVGVVRGTHQLE